ncbi:MAG: phosphomannomutase/phosphoglucomutase [Candidatus Schekmanbacteria bacterium]|nr:phosphomannomutase/phosphoglucomutase [Candidatus Schekmanbacteria bacterium]
MSGIFKAYDVRGIVPEQLDTAVAERIGGAVVRYLSARRLVVGHDMRASSLPLSAALIRGICRAGCDVQSIGLSSTPMLYFAVAHLKADGGVMVTASHNPKEYNGFKLTREQAIPLSCDAGLAAIEALVRAAEQPLPPAAAVGALTSLSLLEPFVEHVLSFADRGLAPSRRRLKIVADAGNGMAGLTIPPILNHLPVDWIPMFMDLDGTFPNHPANPLEPENVRPLEARVIAEGADLGLAFDGDADRVFFVSDEGKVAPSDRITCLIARQVLASERSPILYDLRSSRVVAEEITRLGGTPVRSRVGHAFIKRGMREHGAAFAGELSGHFYFRDNWFADSAEIATVELVNALWREDAHLSDLLRPLDRYKATGEINFQVEDKRALLCRLAEDYEDAAVTWLDGVTIEYPTWWFNLRESNTEPMIRLNLEARTAAEMEDKFAEVRAKIEAYGAGIRA